jgi:hypothetical protein
MIYLIIGILLFIAVLWWDVTSDYKKWKKEIPVKHTKEMIIRCLLLTPSALCFLLYNFSLISIPIVILMQGAWYWEFFDGFYNKLRGQPWRFNGSSDPDDSKLDTFLYHLNNRQEAFLKWGLIALFTAGYIVTKILY